MDKTLRNVILILIVLKSVVMSTVVHDYCSDNIKLLEDALYESSRYMMKEVKNEDVAICIGTTRSGKSTLINYLIGNKLIAQRLGRGKPISISKADSQSLGPDIGFGSTSKTTIPTRWISTHFPNMSLWDAPGFDDNRGPVQDITNAFYLYQLVQRVQSLKIILVIDINDILNDNIKPFLSVLNALETLLGNEMNFQFSSISVIFTKVPNFVDDVPIDVQLVKELLIDHVLSNSSLHISSVSKNFVNYLTENNRIAFFKRASIGVVTSIIDLNILPVINNSTSIKNDTLKKLSLTVSDSSRLCLYNAREHLVSMTDFRDLESIVSIVCQSQIAKFNNVNSTDLTVDQLRTVRENLTSIESHLFNAVLQENDLRKKIEILQSVHIAIRKKIEDHRLLEKVQLLEFIDKILQMKQNDQLAFSLQTVLLSAISKTKEVIKSTEFKLGEITEEKYMKFIQEERENHKKQMDELRIKLEEVIAKNNERKGFFKYLGNAMLDLLNLNFF